MFSKIKTHQSSLQRFQSFKWSPNSSVRVLSSQHHLWISDKLLSKQISTSPIYNPPLNLPSVCAYGGIVFLRCASTPLLFFFSSLLFLLFPTPPVEIRFILSRKKGKDDSCSGWNIWKLFVDVRVEGNLAGGGAWEGLGLELGSWFSGTLVMISCQFYLHHKITSRDGGIELKWWECTSILNWGKCGQF